MKAIFLPSVAAMLLSTVLTAQAQAGPAGDSARPITRAEVRADLAMWQRAGLPELVDTERYDLLSPDVQRRLAEYTRLRRGPEYLAELRRLQPAEARDTVTGPGAPRVN